ncbi:MAG: LysR family transcriptional regulator, partial [Alphaproteobacteria bacterium]|nr:LysR family transcriptional regulator [Alphaproteobacteria bacterium]
MNLRQLEIFRAVMLAGTATAAARQLGIAQPAVSKHLRQMEARLGLALFDRAGKRLVPTADARALLDHAERLFAGLEQVQ